MNRSEKILLFDGDCSLCSKTVQFILKNEANDTISFASLQSETATKILNDNNLNQNVFSTVIFLVGGRLYFKSDAAVELSKNLTFPYNLLRVIRIIPRPLRDFIYSLIADNRKRLFNKSDSCLLPAVEFKERFLK